MSEGFREAAAGKGCSPLIPAASSSLPPCEGSVWPQGGRVVVFVWTWGFQPQGCGGMKTAMKALTFLENH